MFTKFSIIAFVIFGLSSARCTKEAEPAAEPVAAPVPEAPANMDAPEVTPLPPEDDLTEPTPDQSLDTKPAAKPAKKAKAKVAKPAVKKKTKK